MSEPIVLELQSPIELNGERLTRLEFTKLKAKHLKGIKAEPSFDDLLSLVGKSTGVVPGLIGELDIADAMEAVGIVSKFFTNGQKTGDSL